jgi:hypothetical protein
MKRIILIPALMFMTVMSFGSLLDAIGDFFSWSKTAPSAAVDQGSALDPNG